MIQLQKDPKNKVKDFMKNPNSHEQLVITHISSQGEVLIGVQFQMFIIGQSFKCEEFMEFDDFMSLDKYTLVYLLRYAININQDSFNQKLISYYEQGDFTQSQINQANIFLQFHFHNTRLDLENFIELIKWQSLDKNTHSIFAGVHGQFKDYVNEIVKDYMRTQSDWSENEIGTLKDIKDLQQYLTCVMSASCSTYPLLMLETHSLKEAFNLRKIFSFDGKFPTHKVQMQKQTKPLKVIGEYVVLYLKIESAYLREEFFGDILPQLGREKKIHELDFSQGPQGYEVLPGQMYNVLVSTYLSLKNIYALNKSERKIYLQQVDDDKIFILIQSNQKATYLLSQAILLFLEHSIRNEAQGQQVKLSMLAFSNGLNQKPQGNPWIPFASELEILKKQMTHSLKVYDFTNTQQNRSIVMKNVYTEFQLRPHQQQVLSQSQRSPDSEVFKFEDPPQLIHPDEVQTHNEFIALLFNNYLYCTLVSMSRPPSQNPNQIANANANANQMQQNQVQRQIPGQGVQTRVSSKDKNPPNPKGVQQTILQQNEHPSKQTPMSTKPANNSKGHATKLIEEVKTPDGAGQDYEQYQTLKRQKVDDGQGKCFNAGMQFGNSTVQSMIPTQQVVNPTRQSKNSNEQQALKLKPMVKFSDQMTETATQNPPDDCLKEYGSEVGSHPRRCQNDSESFEEQMDCDNSSDQNPKGEYGKKFEATELMESDTQNQGSTNDSRTPPN